jgi:hypothetical protein
MMILPRGATKKSAYSACTAFLVRVFGATHPNIAIASNDRKTRVNGIVNYALLSTLPPLMSSPFMVNEDIHIDRPYIPGSRTT